jgi:glycosyltransferase involved in cell wall biosynthesis
MRILFIAPIPPPVSGQSKASKVLLDALMSNKFDISLINLTKKSLKNGFLSFDRIFEILIVLLKVWKKRNSADLIYLSLAESFLGNIRDLLIYAICYKNRRNIFIHMLGGAGMKIILEQKKCQSYMNQFFIKKLGGVIVEGLVNYHMFSKVIQKEKVHIVPNFAEDFLFAQDSEIIEKFQDVTNINIIYLSNLIPGKGYDELADAHISLEDSIKNQVNINYVGGFESDETEKLFLEKIKNYPRIKYLGKFIDGDEKRKLYLNSHIFCLPTYYPFEGQPISILEAYATGCVVITTNHSGIPYIFSDEDNGYIVEKKSIDSLQIAIKKVLNNKISLKKIAFNNRDVALAKYRASAYQEKIVQIFNDYKQG